MKIFKFQNAVRALVNTPFYKILSKFSRFYRLFKKLNKNI